MTENLKALIKAVNEDEALRGRLDPIVAELREVTDETRPGVIERFVAIANDSGFALAEDDLVVEAPAEGELAEDELEVVAGGWGDPCSFPPSAFDPWPCGEGVRG